MSRERRGVEVSFTVHSWEHLPELNGEPMYADDVHREISAVLQQAIDQWYAERGHDLLICKPNVF